MVLISSKLPVKVFKAEGEHGSDEQRVSGLFGREPLISSGLGTGPQHRTDDIAGSREDAQLCSSDQARQRRS